MIGALRHRIELLTLSRVDDDGGGAVVTWLSGPTIWARVERLTSTRDIAGDRNNRLRRISVNLRIRSDIALGKHIQYEGDPYEVVSIESDGDRDRRLTLTCEEVLS